MPAPSRCSLYLCAALLVSTIATAQSVYIKAGRLILDASKPPIIGGEVLITDGIVAVAGTEVVVPPDARRIDLSAYTVLPSLIDAHIHLGSVGPSSAEAASPAEAALRAAPGMAYALQAGVAAVRVLGSADFIDVALKNAIDQAIIPGPHILAAGHALSIIGGHGDHYILPYTVPLESVYTPLNGFVSSPSDAERAVQLQIKYGARVIKLLASGGVGSPLDFPTDPNLTYEEMHAAVQQAHMHHIKVAAHAENLTSIMDAMRAGVDSIEHGSELNQEAVDYMKSHNVTFVPTVAVVDTFGEARPNALDVSKIKVQKLAKTHFASFQLALKNGVTIAAGSDMRYSPRSQTVFDEVIVEVKYGMTPQQALESATTTAAALLGTDRLGRIAPGLEGNLIAVEGDPLTEIQSIKNVRFVLFKGKTILDKTAASPNKTF